MSVERDNFRKDDDMCWLFGVSPKDNAIFVWAQCFIRRSLRRNRCNRCNRCNRSIFIESRKICPLIDRVSREFIGADLENLRPLRQLLAN